jgi:hypothetical protein
MMKTSRKQSIAPRGNVVSGTDVSLARNMDEAPISYFGQTRCIGEAFELGYINR